MVNNLLVSLVNSVLGSGRNTARGNRAYHCPFCHHHKPKLEINFTENKKGNNPWHCWVCNKKGKTLISLFKQNSAPHDKILELKELVKVESSIVRSLTNPYASILVSSCATPYDPERPRTLTLLINAMGCSLTA